MFQKLYFYFVNSVIVHIANGGFVNLGSAYDEIACYEKFSEEQPK